MGDVACMQAFSNYDSGESSSTAGIVRHGPHTQLAEEGTSSAGATTSLADEDHVTAERAGVGDDVSCSPSSVTIVDLDAATDDERRPGDPDVDEGDRTTTLRVPTPSSWEKYRVVVSVGSTSTVSEQAADDRDVKVVVVADRDRLNDLLKDDVVDRRSVKKPCSCGALSSDAKVLSPFTLISLITCRYNRLAYRCSNCTQIAVVPSTPKL